MKPCLTQKLLVLCAALTAACGAYAQNEQYLPIDLSQLPANQYERTVNPQTGSVSYVYTPAEGYRAGVAKASSKDVTVTLEFKYTDSDGDGTSKTCKPANTRLFNDDYSTRVVNPKDDVGTVTLPAGTYDLFTQFNLSGTMQVKHRCSYAYLVKENLVINNDTTIAVDFADVKNHIHVNRYLPNGDKYLLGREDDNTGEDLDARNISSTYYNRYFVKNGYGLLGGMGGNNDGKITMTGDSITSVWTSDALVSDVSDRYSLLVTNAIITLNNLKDPVYITIGKSGFNKDETLSNQGAPYVSYNEKFRLSPVGLKNANHGTSPGFVGSMIYPDFTHDIQVGSGGLVRRSGAQPNAQGMVDVQVQISEQLDKLTNKDLKATYFDNLFEATVTDASHHSYNYLLQGQYVRVINGKVTAVNIGNPAFAYIPKGGHRSVSTHPAFSYDKELADGILGNNVPVLSLSAQNTISNGTRRSTFTPYYVGRYGENRAADVAGTNLSVTCDGDTLYHGPAGSLGSALSKLYQQKPTTGIVEMKFTNDNINVDTLAGENVTVARFDLSKDDWTAPTLQMLQMRNSANGKVTDRFSTNRDGVIEFCGGDFNYVNDGFYAYDYLPATVKVTYSPNGKNDWKDLPVSEDTDLLQVPGFGHFYRGLLQNVTVESGNKWYDLRFELTDASGNSQTQVLAPAFRIETVTSGVSSVAAPAIEVKVNGGMVSVSGVAEAHIQVCNLAGQVVRAAQATSLTVGDLAHGVYVVTVKSAKGNHTMKVIL